MHYPEKLPDKIYIPIVDDDKGGHPEVYWEDFPYPNVKDNAEFIRKDALLNWLEKCKVNPIITDLQRGNIQELIDKINSL